MNTKTRGVGRPEAEIKYPRGIFTMNDLVEMNSDKALGAGKGVCRLTCIKHLSEDLENNTITLLKDTVKTGKVGKPAFRYLRTSVYQSRLARKAGSGGTPAEAPAIETVETPAPAVTSEVPVSEPEAVPAESVVDATLAALTPAS